MSQFCFDIPAVRGIQAGRVFYTINAPFGVLQRLVAFDTGNVLSRSQRDVNPARAKKISQYVQSNPNSYVLTSLTGVINVHPEFIESEQANVGLLKVSMDSEILLFDGQHRATGIIDALKQSVELRGHTIPLMLFMDMTLEERQQAFSDINGHAVKPSGSISDTYNQRDDLPMLIVEMANTLPMFEGTVDFERNVIGKNSPYLFPVKTLKEATAKLLSVKVDSPLDESQRDLAKAFWQACARPLLWEAWKNWDETAEGFRAGYLSSHGVFLHALGLVGQCLLAQYGCFERLSTLATLNIRRDSSDFVGRCIDAVTGNMVSNTTAIRLTAIKILVHMDCPISPELQALERQYFPDRSLVTLEIVQAKEEDGEEGVAVEEGDVVEHPYASLVRDKWPELSHPQIDALCEQYEAVVIGFGDTLESGRANIQCMINLANKPSTALRTIRSNYSKVSA